MEAEWRTQLHARQFLGKKARIRLDDAIASFCRSREGRPSHKGFLSCANVLLRIFSGQMYLDDLTSHDLERFKHHRVSEGVSNQTIKHNLNLLRGAWEFARKLGYQISELEFPQLTIPKQPIRFLSGDEEHLLLTSLDPNRECKGLSMLANRDTEMMRMLQDAFDLTVILLDTGARYSEIANIEWTQIDLQQRTISLWRSKVGNESILFMTDRVYAILLRRYGNGVHVFQNRNGEARGYSSQSIRKAIRKAGLNGCRIHTFRHTLASRLLQNGMSIYEVREILGHEDIETTMIYAHLEGNSATLKARDVINRLNQRAQPKLIEAEIL